MPLHKNVVSCCLCALLTNMLRLENVGGIKVGKFVLHLGINVG